MRIVDSLAEISHAYDAVLCDLWGCLIDGKAALPEAVEALRAFRASGGAVALLTNAPRPRAEVAKQIEDFGVPRDAWDTITTSGDSARAAMFTGVVGSDVWTIGRETDLGFFAPLSLIDNPVVINRVSREAAEGIVCLGPEDPLADPRVYEDAFRDTIDRGLKLLCANPDIVVDQGEVRTWCAGALAELYTKMGGESLYFGKPHPPVYDLARRRLAEIGRDVSDDRLLAMGDGIATDIKGAVGEGIDSLFITGGLAREDTGTTRQPDPAMLEAWLADQDVAPTFAIGYLR